MTKEYSRCVELLVIGGGPHCLSAVTRILEEDAYDRVDDRTPPFKQAKLIIRKQRQQRAQTSTSKKLETFKNKVMIIDKNGEWMNRWNSQFEFFQIDHLRSTTRLHVDPYDPDSLFLYAKTSNQLHEFKEMEYIERSVQFRGPFFLPSSKIFKQFSDDVVHRYQLHTLIESASAETITPILRSPNHEFEPNLNPVDYFEVILSDGRFIKATHLLIGIGSTNLRKYPDFIPYISTPYPPSTLLHSFDLADAYHHHHHNHSLYYHPYSIDNTQCGDIGFNIDISSLPPPHLDPLIHSPSPPSPPPSPHNLPPPPPPPPPSPPPSSLLHEPQFTSQPQPQLRSSLPTKGETTNKRLLIVGGGLTSVHLVKVALSYNFKSVDLIIRSEMKVKQFDVDVEWLGAIRTKKFKQYRSIHDYHARAKCLSIARGNGSINPEAYSFLLSLISSHPHFLTIRDNTEIIDAYYHHPHPHNHDHSHIHTYMNDQCTSLPAATMCSSSSSSSSGEDEGGEWEVTFSSSSETERFDYIWLGTGSIVDVKKEPLFTQLLEKVKIEVINGLPVIQNDLNWARGCGAYIMGAYAALQLGPGALNIAGARTASSIIAPIFQSILFPENQNHSTSTKCPLNSHSKPKK